MDFSHPAPPHQPPQEKYLNCIRCGLCLAVCPTYREQLTETASPRGRVALARKALEGTLKPSARLLDQMYACFNCLACDAVCPVGLRPAELAVDMRRWREQRRHSPWKQILFGSVVARPERMELAIAALRLPERLGIPRAPLLQGFRGWLPARLRDIECMLPSWPPRPLRQSLPEISDALGKARYRIGFFLGCAQSLMFADQSAATVRVLRRNGCAVSTPRDSVCCGMPAGTYGRLDLARAQAQHNIALFERANVEFVITDCATCGSALKDYSILLADNPAWAERAAGFSRKVRDVSEFLISIGVEKPGGRLAARVTYHDPCHLRRGQGVWRQPRDLLGMIDGIEFVELPESDWCCGSAGSQLITHYRTSVQVLDRKMANLRSTGAQVVASGCPGCRMQLNVGVRRSGFDLRVVHPVELLDRAYQA